MSTIYRTYSNVVHVLLAFPAQGMARNTSRRPAPGLGPGAKRVRWHPSTESERSDSDGAEHPDPPRTAAASLWDRQTDRPPGRDRAAAVPMDVVHGVQGTSLDQPDLDDDEDVDVAGAPPPPPPPPGLSPPLPPASRVRRLSTCLRSFFTHLFSNVGLLTLVGGYVLLGALLFEALEGGYEMNQRGNMKEHRDDCLKELWALTGRIFSSRPAQLRLRLRAAGCARGRTAPVGTRPALQGDTAQCYNCKTHEFVSLNCRTPEFVSLNCKTPEFVSLNRGTVLQFKLTNSGVLQFKLTNSGVLQFKLTNSSNRKKL
ncbi:hypothetical protein KUF71_020286 [Frankliniella fusca]|uniref:Uncharacterized protein n=1 Tax=Frankliniella fusca TaxID=407009 RepID=A0AAE1GWV0_9NEOP|nr:hypothetical protein KUF71_020286 [Frankliniella fusca]